MHVNMRLVGILMVSSLGWVSGEIIPADRLPLPGTWESAGVEGGIPPRARIFANVTHAPYGADNTGMTDATSAIQAAIDACPSGQVVFVPAGRYLVSGYIKLASNVTLRGAGSDLTTFDLRGPISMTVSGPWPPPKVSAPLPIVGGSTRGSTTVQLTDTSSVSAGRIILVDELDDSSLVWTKTDSPARYRGTLHMVESVTANSVTFRPALPIDYDTLPQLSVQGYRAPIQNAGVESIRFDLSDGTAPSAIKIQIAWNCWVYDCEFTGMGKKTIVTAWAGRIEIRKNYLHDQTGGGSNSEGIDLFSDTHWSLVTDNICVAAGFPQINMGDSGPNGNYSGCFGNVISYNYAVDSYYTDPPTAGNHGVMTADIQTNHSPHPQFNLVEGNWVGKFGADSYHGSGSHNTFLRNVATGQPSRWSNATHRIAIAIDRRNLYYNIVGNVFGDVDKVADHKSVSAFWQGATIYRLGFPNIGNQGFSGTHPSDPLIYGNSGPRDLYVEPLGTAFGTTIIEGNWNSVDNAQSWSTDPQAIPNSLYLSGKPIWFASLPWPPVDPANPVTGDRTIIPAGYRYIHGTDPQSTEQISPDAPFGLRIIESE